MSIFQLLDTIWYVFTGLLLFPILFGLVYWRTYSAAEHLLIGLAVGLFAAKVIGVGARFMHLRNHFLYYLETLVICWFIGSFYARREERQQLTWLVAGIALLLPIEVFGWVGFNRINSLTLALSLFLLAICGFLQLKKLIDTSQVVSLRKTPDFYYNLALFGFGFFTFIPLYFKSYFIESSLDLYFFFDTFVVMISGFSYMLLGFGLKLSQQQHNR